MKKSFFSIFMLILAINIVTSKESANSLLRDKCAIIYDNVYDRALLNGFTECEATEFAQAAFLKCKGLQSIQ